MFSKSCSTAIIAYSVSIAKLIVYPYFARHYLVVDPLLLQQPMITTPSSDEV